VNQIHWRPKRKFKEGEFCEIISMDYCPTNSYRFTGDKNPIDPEHSPDVRKRYLDELQSRPDMQAAFKLWEEEGLRDGRNRWDKNGTKQYNNRYDKRSVRNCRLHE
jgi:hypothetical protein